MTVIPPPRTSYPADEVGRPDYGDLTPHQQRTLNRLYYRCPTCSPKANTAHQFHVARKFDEGILDLWACTTCRTLDWRLTWR